MSLLRSIASVGSYTMISRVLGFAREILLASVLGPGMIADAFIMAFKFPNFFRRMFAEGAFNAAFVPLYAGRLHSDGAEPARAFAGEVAAVMAVWMLALTAGAMVAMPWLMYGIAPGWSDQPDKFALTVELTRITFPYLLFMALTAMLSGMLNSMERFAAAAAAPILLNIVMIATLLLIRGGVLDLPGQALAWGVAVAGIGQFLWLALVCRRAGILPHLPRPRLTPGVRRLFRVMLPGVIGAGVVHINLLVDGFLASLLPQGSVSYLYLADRLNQFPLGVVGVSVGIALLPMMTRQLRGGQMEAAAYSQNRAIEFALFLTVPAAAAFLAVPDLIIQVAYQRGAFLPEHTGPTAMALAAFAVGLPAYVLIKAFQPGFYAREDTMTPMKVAIGAVILNIALAVGLMLVLRHVGIALATGLAAWANAGALGLILHRRGQLRTDERLRRRVPRILAAAAAMAAVLWWLKGALAGMFAGSLPSQISGLTLVVLAGAAVYLAVAMASGAMHPRDFSSLLRRRAPPAA